MVTITPPATVFDTLLAALRSSAAYNRDDVVPPAVILWPDEKREWERLLPRLRLALPHLLTFGPYDKDRRTGPAIWIRCPWRGASRDHLARRHHPGPLPARRQPANLAGHRRLPPELRPLAELRCRGVFFSQANGKDWTLAAFLRSDRGWIGLRLGRDAAAAGSIRRAIEKLADVPVADLESKSAIRPLASQDFDALIVDDPVNALLTWLSDHKGSKALWEAGRFETLCSRCQADYGFNPVRDGELVGAEKLGLHETSAWKTVWKRFAVAPPGTPGWSSCSAGRSPRPSPATSSRRSGSSPGPRTTRSRRATSARPSSPWLPIRSRRPASASATWRPPTISSGLGPGPGWAARRWPRRFGISPGSPRRPPSPSRAPASTT